MAAAAAEQVVVCLPHSHLIVNLIFKKATVRVYANNLCIVIVYTDALGTQKFFPHITTTTTLVFFNLFPCILRYNDKYEIANNDKKKIKIKHLLRTEIMVVYLKVITRVCERVDLIKTGPVIKKKKYRIKTLGGR